MAIATANLKIFVTNYRTKFNFNLNRHRDRVGQADSECCGSRSRSGSRGVLLYLLAIAKTILHSLHRSRQKPQMFSSIGRITRKLIRKSTYIDREPINKVSIVILILIDIFVLINVFSGLDSIARWPLSPYEQFPCFSPYQTYQEAEKKGTFDFNAATLEAQIEQNKLFQDSSLDRSSRLGEVSALCSDFTRLEKAINTPENVALKADIDRIRKENSNLDRDIQTLQSQYNSALLEKIAGQAPQQSINQAAADQIKSRIDANKNKIANNRKQIVEKQKQLIQSPTSEAYLKLLNNTSEYEKIERAYQAADFWYPNQQLLLQTLFLLPLIAIAYFWHSSATKRDKGLQSLLSWHLLLIFCIPLLIKFFEFIQFGNLISIVFEWITAILGGLLFIASYGLILLIPLLGFGLIKILQIFVFNPRVQAKNRIKKIHCINCNFKLRLSDKFCPYCGFHQYTDCPHCHQTTYKFMNFCRHCGRTLEESQPLEEPGDGA